MERRAIAVVGMAGRFPGADGVRALWRMLLAGNEGVRDLGDAELDAAGVDAALRARADYVRRAADVGGIELFDAAFFGLAPREADAADPQQRLLLELAWEALEDAGHAAGTFDGAVGVFAGASRSGYEELVRADPALAQALGAFALEIASSRDFLAARVAYALDLRGPALSVATACSTSLVAVHLACQSLLDGECDLALAGGVSIRLPQGHGYLHQPGGVASPDGRCRAYDAAAAGTVAGNGGALVALRRLEDALRDGDRIDALVLATAVNNDGAGKVGFTAPSLDGQAAAIAEALELAGVEAGTIGMLEGHGTGTPLGDPIEVAALAQAFARGGALPPASCALGSIKASLGHLDAAAGVAGLVKAVLALRHGAIPASLHFERPNPRLGLEATPFHVPRATRPWPRGARPRRAGVSSFGIGGTNAHAVLEEAPARAPAERDGREQLLVLSARTPAALDAARERLAARLGEADPPALADAAWTLQAGRRAFAARCALVAGEAGAAARALREGRDLVHGSARDGARAAFLFPGQGAQVLRMGSELARSEPLVREVLARCAALLRPELGCDLLELLDPPAEGEAEARARLDRTRFTQPALFALELALARLVEAHGPQPAALFGHSLGELVAACVAGTLELEDALRVVAARGALLEAQPEGAMLAAALPAAELEPLLEGGAVLAADNGPRACTASGSHAAIEALERRLAAGGVPAKRLRTSHAFHSPLVAGAVEPFLDVLRGVRLAEPRVPWLSCVTGTWIAAEQARDPRYWAEQILRPVRARQCLAELARRSELVPVEVGPGRGLAQLARAAGAEAFALLPRPGREGERASFLAGLGASWTRGVELDWRALHPSGGRARVALPTYPFERRRHWPGPAHAAAQVAEPARPRDPRRAADADVEREVARIWSAVLGAEVRSGADDFFALGGSSLAAVQVLARLREELGAELALAELLEASTLAALAALVRERAQRERSAAALLVLREGGPGAPLVLVPGLDGDGRAFAPLAERLGGERAVLACHGPLLAESVDQLARRNLESVAQRVPGGPLVLGGHSFGALVAFEMARALAAGERSPELLVLLDARPPEEALEPDEATLRRAVDSALPGASPTLLAAALARARSAARWRPRPYAGPALLLLADEPGAEPAERAWRRACADLRVERLAGDHLGILRRPHVEATARVLSRSLHARAPSAAARVVAPLEGG